MKKCYQCTEIKEDNVFVVGENICVVCKKIYDRTQYQKRKAKGKFENRKNDDYRKIANARNKIFREKYKDEINAENRQYYQEHKEEIQKENREKRKQKKLLKTKKKQSKSITEQLRRIISAQVNKQLRRRGTTKNGKSIVNYLPFTLQELKIWLELHFDQWMTWNNKGAYCYDAWNDNDSTTWKWQLDHIVPHSTFNYISMEDQAFKDCWALTNLRPYSAKQNVLDGTRRTRHGGENL